MSNPKFVEGIKKGNKLEHSKENWMMEVCIYQAMDLYLTIEPITLFVVSAVEVIAKSKIQVSWCL